MKPRGLQKAPNDGPEASGGRLLSPRRVMLRLVELLGAIRDLQECSRELPGTLWGAPGELSGSSWDALGASWGALGRLLDAFSVRKSSSVAESLLFRESSSRLHGSSIFEAPASQIRPIFGPFLASKTSPTKQPQKGGQKRPPARKVKK